MPLQHIDSGKRSPCLLASLGSIVVLFLMTMGKAACIADDRMEFFERKIRPKEQIAGDLLEPRIDTLTGQNEVLLGPLMMRLGERRHGDNAASEGVGQGAVSNMVVTRPGGVVEKCREIKADQKPLENFPSTLFEFWKRSLSTHVTADALAMDVLDIGSRRELFVDTFLIDRLDMATLKLHEPQLASPMTESANNLEYGTIIKDGDLFRLYTREARGSKFDGDVTEVTRYCESRDGIVWTKPKLGLVEIDGNKDNNVILHEPWVCHNFSPFLDARPGTKLKERFKALAGVHKGGGLVAFVSEDGIKWTRSKEAPVITSTDFAFDSQNVSFWSEAEQLYVCYFRTWKTPHGKLRSISRATSQDFVQWSEPVALHPNFPGEHLYTSQTHPYFRAPHIYLAMPTRFHPERGESTDILFMSTRGSAPYDRTFREVFIRPGLDPARWGNRSNYAALNVVPTSPTEMSIYTTPFRRFVLRTDGFASVHVGADSGELLTRPLRFEGKEFVLNYATSAGGSLRVEIQDESGNPIPGFTLAESRNFVGDAIEQTVRWAKGSDVSSLASRTVRLRFVMLEADLFAIQFR